MKNAEYEYEYEYEYETESVWTVLRDFALISLTIFCAYSAIVGIWS